MLSTKTIVIAGAGVATAAGLALLGASMAGADQVAAATASHGYPAQQEGVQPASAQQDQGRPAAPNGNTDPSKPMRSDEQLLTGDTAAKVTAAAKAKEPNATIQRVETDSDGVYEAHMVRADGTQVIVQVGSDFQVTNVAVGGPGGPKGGQPPTGGTSGQAPSTSGSTGSQSG